MKAKILFLAHLPPPNHGSARVGEIIRTSSVINSKFDAEYIDISTETSIIGLGKISLRKISRAIATIIKIVRRVHKFKPDLVHIVLSLHGISFYRDFLILALLKISGVSTLIHLHSKGVRIKSKNYFRRAFFKAAFRKCSVILLGSELTDDIYAVKDTSMRVYYVPNGIPSEALTKPKTRTGSKVQLLFFSNLMPSKGAHTLIAAINQLPEGFLHDRPLK